MILIIIPARSGSKGIKNKNLRLLNQKTLLNLTIDFCNNLRFEKFIIVSTDSKKYMNQAMKSNCKSWPLRSKILSDDNALALEVWRYEWLRFEEYCGKKINKSIYLEPTSPFRKPEDIYQCINHLNEKKIECCFTASEVPREYSPYKMFSKDEYSNIKEIIPNSINEKNSNRNLLPKIYQRNGLCYAASRERIIMQKKIIDIKKTKIIVTTRKIVNIDSLEQLQEARKLARTVNNCFNQ